MQRKCRLGFAHRFQGRRGHLADTSRPRLTPPPHTFIQQAFPATCPGPAPAGSSCLVTGGSPSEQQPRHMPPGCLSCRIGQAGAEAGRSFSAPLTPVKPSPRLLSLPCGRHIYASPPRPHLWDRQGPGAGTVPHEVPALGRGPGGHSRCEPWPGGAPQPLHAGCLGLPVPTPGAPKGSSHGPSCPGCGCWTALGGSMWSLRLCVGPCLHLPVVSWAARWFEVFWVCVWCPGTPEGVFWVSLSVC